MISQVIQRLKLTVNQFTGRFFESQNDQYRVFQCNICNAVNHTKFEYINREGSSCYLCGSSVRMRAIINIIIREIYGSDLTIKNLPTNKNIRGIGMSDWEGYASRLKKKFDYTNTFYHKEPMLDIINISESTLKDLEFIISSDVFEHVESPVSKAFSNTYKLLKRGGFFIITVPYSIDNKYTLEHFPTLNEWSIKTINGEKVLVNKDINGEEKVYKNLIFHGGPGATLEMRLFSLEGLIDDLRRAGFDEIEVVGRDIPQYGIYWKGQWSLPIIARKH